MTELTVDQQAAAALAAAIAEDGDDSVDGKLNARVAEIKAGNTADVAAVEADEGTTETDSFTSIDFNELPPELQGLAKSLQGDYTRKAQKVAEDRKRYETLDELGGID